MNKSQLVEALSQRVGLTQRKAEEVANVIFGVFTDALRNGERIEVRGFGSFMVKNYHSYIGRNPKTGESIEVPSKKLPFFKVGKELKERVDYPNKDR
jgi:integration host factor subunit beta